MSQLQFVAEYTDGTRLCIRTVGEDELAAELLVRSNANALIERTCGMLHSDLAVFLVDELVPYILTLLDTLYRRVRAAERRAAAAVAEGVKAGAREQVVLTQLASGLAVSEDRIKTAHSALAGCTREAMAGAALSLQLEDLQRRLRGPEELSRISARGSHLEDSLESRDAGWLVSNKEVTCEVLCKLLKLVGGGKTREGQGTNGNRRELHLRDMRLDDAALGVILRVVEEDELEPKEGSQVDVLSSPLPPPPMSRGLLLLLDLSHNRLGDAACSLLASFVSRSTSLRMVVR
jgi:hypothetical protein